MLLKGHAADINKSCPGKYHDNHQVASAWNQFQCIAFLAQTKLKFWIFFEHLSLKKYFDCTETTLEIDK